MFLTLTDFWMAGVIQGLLLNFNLYLLTDFNEACSSRIEIMLSKNGLMERFTFCWPRWRTQYQPPPLSVWGTSFSPKFWKGGGGGVRKKWVPGADFPGGAYYVPCQKRLYKMKYGFKGLIFKCKSWPALAKQPIND